MSKDYVTHWVIGFISTIVWFWGDRAGIPAAAITLASAIVPSVVAHAIAYTPKAPLYEPPPALNDPVLDSPKASDPALIKDTNVVIQQ